VRGSEAVQCVVAVRSLSVVLVLAAWQPLGAQPPVVSPTDDVEQRIVAGLLASPDPGQQAWGAQLAGNYGQTKFVPDLRRLLVATHPDVQLQALDSLIRLKAEAPSDELLLLWPTHRTPVLILLARAAKENQEVLRSLSKEDLDPKEWVAVYNLLVSNKAPGVAAELLAGLKVRVTVTVRDGPDVGPGYGEGGSVGVAMCGGPGFRPGFPPLYLYVLADYALPGDVLLAPGRHPIHYRRQQTGSNSYSVIDRNVYRYDYLADLLMTQPECLPLRREVSRIVTWKGADEYLAELQAAREQVEASFQSLVRMLKERDLATSRETDGLRPQVEFNVIDKRANQQPPLTVPEW
jgi:hypothetical protein